MVAKRVWPNSPAFSIWLGGRCFPTGSIISPGANSCQLPSAAGPSRTTPRPAGRAGGIVPSHKSGYSACVVIIFSLVSLMCELEH